MKTDIETVRGHLNKFKDMVKAVEFAVEAVDDHKAREARNKELEKLIKNGQADLSTVQSNVAGAKAQLKLNLEKAESVVTKAQDEGANIIDQAKAEAKKLTDAAQSEVSSLKSQKASLQSEINSLTGQVDNLKKDKVKAQKELDTLTGSLQSALDRVKPPGKD